MDIERGKQVFDELVQYPLPPKDQVKDYIFYFESEPKGYFDAARKFLGEHYKNHLKVDALSLEDMFARLHADIASGRVTQIRELVLVAHGNAAQLWVPVVKAAPGVDPVYKCVTEYSLSALQVDMASPDGKFASFNQARKDVAAHMLDNSWVTIRACNIGNSPKTLYALYALFGGRANVYGPTKYTFFGDCAVGPNHRVTTKFGVYDYLVKQHFLATNEHTPTRQAAIVTDLLDPESYSAPFELASAELIGGSLDDINAYQELVDQLNAYRLSDALRTKFAAKEFPLSAGASVVKSISYTNVKAPQRSVWYVRDRTVQSEDKSYDLVYEISDQTTGDVPQKETLEARARIATLVSSSASFPFQLFFDQDTEDEYEGIVVRLAGYAVGGDSADPHLKDEFTATEALLDAGSWTDGAIDLAQRINAKLAAAGLDVLADPPPPIQPSAAGTKGTWTVAGAQPLVIRREASSTPDGFLGYSLTAYRALTDRTRVQTENEVIAHKGRVPDTPGTELTAYLDRFTADDLDGLLAYLRSNYRPAYAFYIHHAQQAMERKRDFLKWYAAHLDPNTVLDDYGTLRPGESDDLKAVAFDFDFNDNWREVKAFSPYVSPFQTDLFTDDDLRTKLKIEGTWICDKTVPVSPFASRVDARNAEVPGNERFYASTKMLWEAPPPPPVDDGCLDLKKAFAKWKEFRNLGVEPDVAKWRLQELEKGSDDESYYKKIQETLEPFHFTAEISEAIFDTPEPYKWITERIAEHVTSKALAGALEAGAFGGSLSIVFTLPFEMWLKAAEANLEGVEVSVYRGELVALRLWVYKLMDICVTLEGTFPESVSSDVEGNFRGGPDAFDAAWQEVQRRDYEFQDHVGGFTFSFDDAKRGFVFAALKFGWIGPQIVEDANKAVDERIAAVGLNPCQFKVLTDVGLLDRDKMRRQQIIRDGRKILDSWRKV